CTEEEKKTAKSALEKSGAWAKIETLSKGGDTVLTREFEDDGVGLSGGESQKVSTARLFARDFEIAVLDEPSSALDPIAEYKMYENLIHATENKTVVYISHRLSSATLSDKIIVIDKGKVVEQGKHQDLMQLGGVYSKMFALQASNYNREEDNDA
ncbi:MAG: ABC transporter ATP-binding protein, partial [Eubacterium sp.]|nr:ABC transporter ATP-binding protein [Eubacterium sp.]